MEHVLSMWKASGSIPLMPKREIEERFTRDENYHHLLDKTDCVSYDDNRDIWVVRVKACKTKRFHYLKTALDYRDTLPKTLKVDTEGEEVMREHCVNEGIPFV